MPSRVRATGRRWVLGSLAAVGLLLCFLGVIAAVGGADPPLARLVRSWVRGPVRVWLITYRSHAGDARLAYVDLPAWYGPGNDPSLPLIISPHGRGATPAANSALWGNLPAQGPFAVVNPAGRGRRLLLMSWGDPGQIADLARMPALLQVALPWLRVAPGRIYAVGGSMGGQESLLLLARYPHLLAGVVAFDAPVDLARRYYDFRLLRCGARCRGASGDASAAEVQELAQVEIGGTPATDPRAYALRSPLTYARQIAFSDVPVEIWWSRSDRVVVDGARQAGLLYRRIKQLNPRAPVLERIGSWRHDADMNVHTKLPIALLTLGLLPLDSSARDADRDGAAQATAQRRRQELHQGGCDRLSGATSPIGRLAARSPAYGWPLKPFDRQHPIRGMFGDPRTVFHLADPADPSGLGRFSFHNGVDISGTPGQPVYPVVSGRVVVAGADRISVRSGARLFQYWHLRREVQRGERVTARITVLGLIRPEWRHVHLGESLYGRQIDPLLHLTPYRDSTAPVVAELDFSDPRGRLLDPLRLHGPVRIVAAAHDTPALPVPGAWHGMPVTPALVRFSLTEDDGRRVITERTVADFRITIPEGGRSFWRVYATGTYQNFPTVGLHFFYRQPGNYLFNLTPTPLDTARLRPGRYLLTVEAQDLCGNRSSLSQPVVIERSPHRPLRLAARR